MSTCATQRVLFRGAGVRIEDFRCRAPRSRAGALEVADAHYVVLVRRGVFEKHAGSRSAIATSASTVCFEPGEEYRIAHPLEGGDECTVIRVDEPLLAETLESLGVRGADRARFPVETAGPSSATAHLRQWELLRALRSGDGDASARQEQALGLLAAALEGALRRSRGPLVRKSSTRRNHEQLVARAAGILAARIEAPPGLEALARELCASPFHLCRLFRAHTGLSIHAYVMQLRVREALRRIAEGERDLLGLALDLGFSHHGHLGRAFQRSFAGTPSAVRARLMG